MNNHYTTVSWNCRSVLTGLAIGVAIAMVSIHSSTAVGADHLDPTKTHYSLPLPEPPTIDGFIDPAESWVSAGGATNENWHITIDDNLEDFIRGGQLGDGTGNAPIDNEDLSFRIFAGHDSSNLYIAAQILDFGIGDDSTDPGSENGQTWLDDSVEVFIDGDNSNFPDRDTTGSNPEVVDTGGQFVIALNNAYRQAEAGNPGYGPNDAWYARADITDAGWDAEFRISLDAIGNPQPGDVIGFSIAVNDDDDGGPNERQVIWTGSPHVEESYGNLVIGGKRYEAPKAVAPTIDGMIGPDEYAGAPAEIVNGHTGVYHLGVGDDTWEEGDHSYTYWVVHDDEAVYVGVDVVDDQINTDTAEAGSEDGSTWLDDSIEIFFDPDDSDDSGRGTQEFEGQYVLTANGAWRDNEANNPTYGENDDWFAVAAETETGYSMEFKVDKSALLNPEDGTIMGFNVALNDDDGADRKIQLNWSGLPHSEFTYGFLTLGDLATDPLDCNGDGVVDAGDLECVTPETVGDTLTALNLLPGDLNADTIVDFSDFLIISTNYSRTDVGYTGGDIDVDGTVAFADFLALSTNYNMSSAGAAAVPEPCGLVLLAIGALWLGQRRRGRQY